jgi:hypothetical protein
MVFTTSLSLFSINLQTFSLSFKWNSNSRCISISVANAFDWIILCQGIHGLQHLLGTFQLFSMKAQYTSQSLEQIIFLEEGDSILHKFSSFSSSEYSFSSTSVKSSFITFEIGILDTKSLFKSNCSL